MRIQRHHLSLKRCLCFPMNYSVVYREQISLEMSSAISNQDKIKLDIAKVMSKIDVVINSLSNNRLIMFYQ